MEPPGKTICMNIDGIYGILKVMLMLLAENSKILVYVSVNLFSLILVSCAMIILYFLNTFLVDLCFLSPIMLF